jgi:hypothetical protein
MPKEYWKILGFKTKVRQPFCRPYRAIVNGSPQPEFLRIETEMPK